MLYFFTGTDTDSLREKLNAAVDKAAKGASVMRVTDAHALHDLDAALRGSGLFGEAPTVILDGVLSNPDMAQAVLERLPQLARSVESFFLLESAPDAAMRKTIEKHAEKTERIDLPKQGKQESIFGLVSALQRGQKKELWVGYQRELAAGKAPEAIHGVLFWAAKQLCLRDPSKRAKKMVAELAELPHEARRRGVDLEYALERFVLAQT